MFQKIVDKLKITFHNYRKDFEDNEKEIEKLTAEKNREKNKYEEQIKELSKELEQTTNKKETLELYAKLQDQTFLNFKEQVQKELEESQKNEQELKIKVKKYSSAKGGYAKKINQLTQEKRDLVLTLGMQKQEIIELKNKLNIKKYANCDNHENYHEHKNK